MSRQYGFCDLTQRLRTDIESWLNCIDDIIEMAEEKQKEKRAG
jgi:hypothetical protein